MVVCVYAQVCSVHAHQLSSVVFLLNVVARGEATPVPVVRHECLDRNQSLLSVDDKVCFVMRVLRRL